MPIAPRVKDRLFTLLCLVAAVAVLVIGLSRGNPKVAIGGAAVFMGYAVLQSVARRLTPGARLVMGSEADAQERLIQFKATRLAGQIAVGLVIVGVVVSLFWEWDTGLWVAGACSLILVAFIGSLIYYTRAAKSG
ncbi:MAG: hypothetical protein WBG57_10705 [Ornithinimicrobium sp.]